MSLRIATFFLVFIFSFANLSAQEKPVNSTTKDSVLDGKQVSPKAIEPVKDTTAIKTLKDNEFAAQIDKKWLEELYSTNLFDTIYKTVSNLKYDEVDYPELSTDTLKARLAELNARTPFNVDITQL